jgi:fibronectin-binding autotransporter adhesin
MIRSSLRVAVCSAVVLLAVPFALAQTAYQSNGTGGGDWANATSWSPSGVPGALDTVTIIASDTITVTSAVSADTVTLQNSSGPKTLRVQTGGSLIIDATGTALNVLPSTDGINLVELDGGTITVSSGNTVVTGGALSGARINFTSNSGTLTVGGHLSFSGNSVNAQLQFGGATGNVVIGGNLTSGGNVTTTGSTFTFNGSGNQTIHNYAFDDFVVSKSGGVAFLGGATTINGNLSVSTGFLDDAGGQITMTDSLATLTIGSTGQLNLGGSGSATTFPAAITSIAIAPGGTVQYQAGTAQSISTTPTYQMLKLTTVGAAVSHSFTGTLNVAQDLTILDNGANTVALLAGSNTLDVDRDLLGDGALTVNSGGAIFLGGDFANTLSFSAAVGSSFTYDGTLAQNVGAFIYRDLTINKVNIATLSGATSVLGTLTIANGSLSLGSETLTPNLTVQINASGTLDIASGTFVIGTTSAATVTVNGAITGGTGMFRVNGTTGVNFTGTGTISLHNFDVNNTSNAVDFQLDATANGFITLDGGRVNISSPKVFSITTSGVLTRSSGSAWFTGYLALVQSASTLKRFEVGTGTSYLPVDVTPTSAGTMTMRAVAGAHPSNTGSNGNILLGWWEITTGTVSATDLTFTYNNIDVNGCELCYVIGRYNNPSWSVPGGSVNTAGNTATISAVGAYVGEWTLGASGSMGQFLPSVVTLNPTSQSTGGPLTLYGSNFTGATALTFFNGVNQPTYTVVTDNEITTTVPAGASTGIVQVTNGAGTNSTSPTLTITGPQSITSIANGAWSSNSTWSCNCVPASIDSVTIDGETVTVGSPASIADLTLTAGALGGASTLTVTNSFTWTAGDVTNNAGTLALAATTTTTISGGSNRGLGRIVTNAGTVNYSATGQIQHTDATFTNNGTFNLTSALNWAQSGAGSFVNGAGANFNKTVDAGTGTFGVSFTNNGTVTLSAGLLAFFGQFHNASNVTLNAGTAIGINAGGSHSGAFSIASTAAIEYLAGTTTFSGTFTGAGTVRINGASMNFSGTPGGDHLDLDAGSLGGTGTLTINGSFDWTAGSVSNNAGTLILANTASSTISGASNRSLGRIVTNNGALAFSATGQIQHVDATFTNNGTFTLTSLVNWTQSGAGSFSNGAPGNFNKTTDGGNGTFSVPVSNSGAMTLSAGSLTFNGSFSNANSVLLSPGTAITVASGGSHSGTFTIDTGSVVTYTGGTTNFSGTFVNAGMVRINGGSVNFTGTPSGDHLDFDSGTIGGTGALTINGSFDWTGGAIGNNAGSLTLAGTATSTISGALNRSLGRIVTNSGTLTFSATGQIQHNDAVFTNNGTFNLTSLLNWAQSGAGSFVNGASGNFNKTGDTGTGTVGVGFTNNGAMTISTGALTFTGAFANANAVTLDPATTLTATSTGSHSGSFSLGAGATVVYTGGTTTFSGTFTGTGRVHINGATMNMTGSPSGDHLDLDAGTLGGTGTLTINGSFDWTGGAVTNNTGTLSLAATASSTISGAASRSLGRIVNNAGTLAFSATGQIQHTDATFTNNGTFNLTSLANWTQSGAGSFVNGASGTFDKTVDIGTGLFGVPFTNNGVMTLSAGALGLNGTFMNANAVTLDPGTTLTAANGGSHSGSFSLGAGSVVHYTGGTTTFSGTFAGTGMVRINGATMNFSGTPSGDHLDLDAGTLSGTGTLTINGSFDWTGGSVTNNAGTLVLAGTAASTISGAATRSLGRIVNNAGTLTWSGNGTIQHTDAVFTNSGTMNITSGASWTQNGAGSFVNSGTINKTTAPGTTPIGVSFNTSGGALNLAAGKLQLNGTVTFNASSSIRFDISGTNPLTNFGVLELTGALNPNGTIDVDVIGGHVPSGGASYPVMAFASRTGTFPSEVLGFGAGRSFTSSYTPTTLALVASGPTVGSVSPNIGTTAGGTSVTITGTGFQGTTPSEAFTGTVSFGGTNATGVQWQSATTLTATTPAQAAGPVTVTVTNADAQPGSLANAFTYATAVTSVDVTSAADSGAGTLREAITKANSGICSPNCTITFSIGSGLQTINLTTALPAITASGVTIDGTTQEGFTSAPLIDLNGAGTSGQNAQGLVLAGGGAAIKSLLVRNFNDAYPSGYAIHIASAGNSVKGSYIGTNAAGTAAQANGAGVVLDAPGATGNTIGGITAADRNVISGNTRSGISIENTASANTVAGNYIGTDVTGASVLGNGFNGVNIEDADNNVIGGATAGARNVISGNGYPNVYIGTGGASGNTVKGNYIGTNAAGTAALTNGDAGVMIADTATNNLVGDVNAGEGNLISGNNSDGVVITDAGTNNNVVRGNVVGLDASGASPIANLFAGIAIINGASSNTVGGTLAGARNVSSGNTTHGIAIVGAGTNNNIVRGNYTGLDTTGASAVANGSHGIAIWNGASGNTIGGPSPAQRNVSSGNGAAGIALDNTNNNVVAGNLVGRNAADTATIANATHGFDIYGAASGNTIGGSLAADGNKIVGHTAGKGVWLDDPGTSSNVIQNNVITGNGKGVVLSATAGTANAIFQNQISGNTTFGIDLGDNLLTGNDGTDSDPGPNNLQNFPVLTNATLNGTSLDFKATINSTGSGAGGLILEVFKADTSSPEQALTYLARTGCLGVNLSNFAVNLTVAGLLVGDEIVATATTYTDGTCTTVDDGTSEFSAAAVVANADPHWASPVSGNWNDPTKWSTGAVPTSVQTAYLDAAGSYTVTVNAGQTVGAVFVAGGATLNVANPLAINNASTVDLGGVMVLDNGGTLSGPGAWTIDGGMNWVSGTLNTTLTVAATRTLALNGSGTTILFGASGLLQNNGTVNWISGSINAAAGAVINNNAGATFDIQSNGSATGVCCTTALTLNNAGTFTKSGGAGVTQINAYAAFTQSGGSLNANSGTLELQGGATFTGGAVNIPATLKLDQNATFAAPVTLTAAGTFQVNAGTTAMSAAYTNVGTTLISGGTLSLANASTTNALTLSGAGTLGGAGSLTVNGPTSWTNGTIAGTLINPSPQVVTMSGTGTSHLFAAGGTLQNNGTVNWTNGNINATGPGAVINNASGATFDIQSNGVLTGTCCSTMITINNAGTFTKSAGGGLTQINAYAAFSQTAGSLNASSGMIELQGGANVSGGAVNALAGATLKLYQNALFAAPVTLAAAGTIEVGFGVTTMNAAYANVGTTAITGGTLSLANASTTNALAISGSGTLAGAGSLTVNGPTSWTNGTLNTTLINPATRVVTMAGTGTSLLLGATGVLQNNGTVNWTGGNINASAAGAVINNNAGATFDIQVDGLATGVCCTTALTINNAGTFTKSGGTAITQLNSFAAFTQSGGSLNANSGTIELQGGATISGGAVNVPATLKLHGFASFAAPVTLTAAGTIEVSNGTTTVNTSYTNVGTTTINGGTLSLANASTTNAFSLSGGGTLTGAGSLTVNGPSSWTSGVLSSTLINPSPQVLTMAGSGTSLLVSASGVLQNNGVVNWTSGNINGTAPGAVINNNAGGTFNIQADGFATGTCCSTALTFNNGGTVTKSGGTGITQLNSFAAFAQSGGSLNANAGTLELQGGASITGGAVNVPATLRLDGNATFAAPVTLTAAGTLHVSSGTTTMNAAYTNVGATTVSGGTLSLANASTTNAFNFSGGGTLAGAGSLTVNGPTSWTNGILATTLVNPATRTASLAGTGTSLNLTTGGTFDNFGTANWSSGTINGAATGAVLNNNAGALFDMQADLNFSAVCCTTALTLNNAGTFRKSAGAAASNVAGFVALNQNGVLDIRTGSLHFQSSSVFAASGPSTLQLWLTSAATYSRLTFASNATLGGTLNINYFGGFTPAVGNTFQVVTFAANPGPTDFAAKTGLSYGSGSLAYALNATDVTLTAGSSADVSISKTAPASVTVSQNFAYTIQVTNAGPDNALSLSVTDTLPVGVTFGSFSAPGWSCSGTSSITCTMASLAPGSSTITVNVTAPGTTGLVSNTANLTASNDSTGGNNSSTANTNVTTATANLALTNTPSLGSIAIGGSVTYSIVVTNNGPLNATGVVVTDNLPPGQIATSATWGAGTCTGTTSINCSIGALANGASATVTLVVTANTGGTWTNTAGVTLAEADPNLADNSANATVAVTGSQTLTVLNNGSAGNGTLAQAILDANNGVCSPAPCNIHFNLSPLAPISGAQPTLGVAANLDGTTQPGYTGTPLVQIDGTAVPAGSFGLVIHAPNSSVTGLSIQNFSGANSGAIAIGNLATGVRILGNSMNANTIGIDLGVNGPTANDAGDGDSGENDYQNFPVVSSAVLNAGNLTVTTSVDSPSTGSMRIEVFLASGSNGQVLLGSVCRTTPVLNDTFAIATTSIAPGQSIVTTATSYTGAGCSTVASGTSEFSAPFTVTGCTVPDATITAPANVCAGVAGYTASVPVQGGVTYAWSITNGIITSATNGNSITFTAGPTGTTQLNVTVTAAPGCAASNSYNAPIGVAPNAAITAPGAVCAGAGMVASVPSQPGATYNWTVTNGTFTTGTASNSVGITAGASGNVVVGVTVTIGSCATSNSHIAAITPLPASAITAPTSTCPGAAGLTASVPPTAGATYAWSITNGTITSATNVATINFTAGASGTTTLNVTVTANTCVSSSAHNVTITANPTATISAPAATCASSPGNTASVPPQAGATYAWSITNGAISSATNGNGITFTAGPAGTTTVSVVVTANGCTSNGSHNVAITAPPNTAISAPATVCANSTGHAASVPAQTGATYNWTVTNGTITSPVSGNAITFDAGPSGNVVLGVTVTIGGCTNNGTSTVTTTAPPSATITAPASTCPSSAGLTASVAAVGGATYAWSAANGTITSATNTNSITFTAGASGTTTLSVTVTNGGCVSTATHNVTIVANPAATITAPANVCANATGNAASVTAQAGATYAWTITGGTITSATNASSITFTAGPSGNVALGVTVTAGSCTSTGNVTIPIVAGLTPAITGPATVCPNTPFTLDAGPGFTTYAWSNGATSQTITVAQSAATTYTVTVTSGGCSAQASKTVALSPAPFANVTAPGTVNPDTAGHVASVGSQAGATYNWTVINGTITAGQGTNAITFTAGGSGTVDIGVVVAIGGCTANGSTSVAIAGTVVEADLSVTKTAPATVNAGQTFTYTITVSNDGPSNATNVVITDDLPSGLTLVGVNSGWPCTTTATAVRCSGQFAVVGPNAPIAITVRAPSTTTTLTNTVAITSATPDPNTANNSASATTQITGATCATVPPSLTAPADNATSLTSPLTFTWSAVAGATYEVWLENAGTTALLGSTSATSLTASVPSGPSTWYVVARLGAACDALVSARRTFNVTPGPNCATHGRPQINAPFANASVSSPVTISWTPVPQAIGYRVWMSVAGQTAQDIGTTDGAISLTANIPPGTITIHVQALFSGCPSTESDRVTFTVNGEDTCADRGTATLIAPANNAIVNSSSVEFRWNAAASAEEYRLWASIGGGAAEVLGITGETSLRRIVGRGEILWWVESVFDGCSSIESARFRFNVASQSCGNDRPNTVSPANNAAVTNAIVTFNWSPIENALAYQLWLSLEDGSPTLMGTTAATSLTHEVPPGKLEWFVRALVDRCDPRDSSKSKFTYTTPAACANNERAVSEAPEVAAEVASPVSFRWSAPVGATRYELYVIRGDNPPQLAVGSTTNDAEANLAAGRVRWFVRSYFGNNCPPLDSIAQPLTIVATPQACAPLDAPLITAPGQISSGLGFRIRWSPIAGATSYQLQLAGDANFTGAESITTSGTEHELTRTNNGTAPVAVYARVRAVDGRCTSAPSLSLFGPTSAIFILPAANADPSVPASSRGIVTFTIPLGSELAGATFTAVPTQPWLSVTPASGVVGPTGTTLIVTANTATLPLGASLGGIAITTTTPTVNGIRGEGTSTSTKPVTISLVSPVTPSNRNTPPPDAMIIPAVANADGINAHFQSDVRVTNASAVATKYQVTFTPSGEGLTSSKQTTLTIDPGRTVALDDVLKTWFGTGGASTTGTLEVRPLTQTSTSAVTSAAVKGLATLSSFASSRTFNATSNGTYGQYIPAIPFASFVGKPAAGASTVLSLQQVAQSSQYRTNLGIVEANGEPASVLVTVFGQGGTKLTSFPVELKAGQHTQLNSFLSTQGITSLADGRVEVQVTGGNGKVTAYASVLDNATADPLLVTPVSLADAGNTKWVVPGVADLNNGVANWQTDLRLFNASPNDVDATLSFYSQNGGEPKTATITIPAGQVRELDKTLTSLFNAPNDGGAVHIATASSSRLIATARTYNQTSSGTYGQFISAVTPLEAAAVGTRALQLLQVEESPRYRSNIGLAEVSGKPVTLEVSMITADAKTTGVVRVDLAANEFRQFGGVLKALGDEVHNARVTVRAISGDGRVAAYASVIDMVTQDPTYIPAQ